ncbi:MAG: SurA N-terminal domain-containing protein [Rhodobacterales bacterium]|nr:SurA N-terminal domain-containing protein [Rhodobacterales bacterium]
MKLTKLHLQGTAIAAVLSLPLMGGAALAQQSQSTDQDAAPTASAPATNAEQTNSAQEGSGQTGAEQAGDTQGQDSVLATVGDAEIRGSDVMMVIEKLPPQLQSQPTQMLVPMALEQLIFRELVLEQARSQQLADDPEVVALVEQSAPGLEEDAMVQVWIDRELGNAITDEAVQDVYDQAKAQGQQNLPSLEQARPQIEQFLQQQAIRDIQTQLMQGADVVFYDASGQPMEQTQNSGGSGDQPAQDSGTGNSDSTTGSAADGQSGDSADETSD